MKTTTKIIKILLSLLFCSRLAGQDQELKDQHQRYYKEVEKITPHIQRLVDDLADGLCSSLERSGGSESSH